MGLLRLLLLPGRRLRLARRTGVDVVGVALAPTRPLGRGRRLRGRRLGGRRLGGRRLGGRRLHGRRWVRRRGRGRGRRGRRSGRSCRSGRGCRSRWSRRGGRGRRRGRCGLRGRRRRGCRRSGTGSRRPRRCRTGRRRGPGRRRGLRRRGHRLRCRTDRLCDRVSARVSARLSAGRRHRAGGILRPGPAAGARRALGPRGRGGRRHGHDDPRRRCLRRSEQLLHPVGIVQRAVPEVARGRGGRDEAGNAQGRPRCSHCTDYRQRGGRVPTANG